jgi:NADH:ubiquinone oxidoreductase subunit 5 (subunit L)/multisubunit Na+/H+ antiporter MnhA subunit
MLVLSKNRILMVFAWIIISIGAFGVMNYSKETDKTIATVALPVNSKVIILDAGHGNPDGRSC